MSKSLKTLIKISKSEVDTLQKELSELQRRQDIFLNKIAKMNADIEREKKLANDNFEDHEIASSFVAFAAATKDKIEIAQTQVDILEKQIEAKRDELREAFSEQKKFEIVQANKLAKELAERNKKEDNKLDEIGVSMFIRSEGNE
jgi:flagellar export protein FliJ